MIQVTLVWEHTANTKVSMEEARIVMRMTQTFKEFRALRSSGKPLLTNITLNIRRIASWHNSLIQTAQLNGRIDIPSGRFFPIVPTVK